jgi:outer membrane lipoprotein SlyB
MNELLRVIAVAAAISLAGCAGNAQLQGPSLAAAEPTAAQTFETCEQVIYRSANSDATLALQCADVLDIWQ